MTGHKLFLGFCLLSLCVIAIMPTCLADEEIYLEITSPVSEYDAFSTSIDIPVTVRNPSSTFDITGINVSASGGTDLRFSYSPTSATIATGGEEEFTVTVTGRVCKYTKIKIAARGPDGDGYDIHSDSVTIGLVALDAGVELIYPSGNEMTVVVENASQPAVVAADLSVKNVGEANLDGVTIKLVFDEEKLNCTINDGKDIAKGKIEKFALSCKNVSSEDRLSMVIQDSCGAVSEPEGFVFMLVDHSIDALPDIVAGGNETYGNPQMPSSSADANSWLLFRGNPERTGYSLGEGDLGKDRLVSWTYSTPGPVFGTPAVADLNSDGKLEVVVPIEKDPESRQKGIVVLSSTGKEIWSYDTKGTVYSSPALADIDSDGDFEVVFGTNRGVVYALNGADGKKIWEFDAKTDFFRSSPVVYDLDGDGDVEVYIGSGEGLYSLDGKAGTKLWLYETGSEVSSSPTVGELDGDPGLEIAFASDRGVLYALNNNGGVSWYLDLGSRVVYSTPAVTPNNKLVIGTQDGRVLLIGNKKIEKSYAAGASISSSPGVAKSGNKTFIVVGAGQEDSVHGEYVGGANNKICGLDENLKMLWCLPTGEWSVFASPAMGDVDRDLRMEAIIGSREGKLMSIDAESGGIDWVYFEESSGLFASPVLADVDADGDLEIIASYRLSRQVKLIDSPDKPDLLVESLTFSNPFPEDNEEVNITAVVKNSGDLPAKESLVKFYRRWGKYDEELSNFTVKELRPGESQNIIFAWDAIMSNKEIGIYAKADSMGAINESNWLNNGLYKGFYNDLYLTKYGPANSTKKGYVMSVSVFNKGRINLSGVEVVVVLVNANGTKTQLTSKTFNALGNKEYPISLTFSLPANASGNLSVVIDPKNIIKEVSEDNNAWEYSLVPGVPSSSTKRRGKSYFDEINQSNPIIIIALLGVVFIILWQKVIKKRIGGRIKKGATPSNQTKVVANTPQQTENTGGN